MTHSFTQKEIELHWPINLNITTMILYLDQDCYVTHIYILWYMQTMESSIRLNVEGHKLALQFPLNMSVCKFRDIGLNIQQIIAYSTKYMF